MNHTLTEKSRGSDTACHARHGLSGLPSEAVPLGRGGNPNPSPALFKHMNEIGVIPANDSRFVDGVDS